LNPSPKTQEAGEYSVIRIMNEPASPDSQPTLHLQPDMPPAQPPVFSPQPLGYPPGMAAPNPYGYPTGPMMPPQGYPMQPGYSMPPGYAMPPGYPTPMQPGMMCPPGYPIAHPAYPMMLQGCPAPAPMAAPAPPKVASTSVISAAGLDIRSFAGAGVPQPPKSSHEPVRAPNPLVRMWRQVGGGSLALSLLIHAGILSAAGFIVFTTAMQEQQVDFLPGGGSRQGADASSELSHQIQQKKRTLLKKSMPRQRLVSTRLDSDYSLPDAPPDLLDVPDVSSLLGGGGKIGGGMGRGGSGGGFNNGTGMGGMSGMTFKPMMMFGMELKDTRKIAVVMDISRSMTKYLPIVAKELDKVARGSPLVLYFGCGLKTPPRQLEDKIRKVGDERFDKFWYYWEGKHEMDMLRKEYDKLKVPTGDPMPMEALYHQMKNRPNTYFIDFNGITYTSPALMSKEVVEADTLYWFSDFQDAVDVEHVKDVMRKLRGRKQKLYMHASLRGKSFEILRDELCLPLGGQVLETKVE